MRGQGLSLFLVLLPSFIVTLTGLNQSSVYFTALWKLFLKEIKLSLHVNSNHVTFIWFYLIKEEEKIFYCFRDSMQSL